MLTAALWCVDRYDTALEHLDLALEHARRQGSPSAYAMARAGRAGALRRAGRLLEAEADALDALALAAEHASRWWCRSPSRPPRRAGRPRAARPGRAGAARPRLRLRHPGRRDLLAGAARARPAAPGARARGGGCVDFLAAGRALLRAGTPTPARGPWRSDAALALAASGFAERAGRARRRGARPRPPRGRSARARHRALAPPRCSGRRRLAPPGWRTAAARLRSAGSPVELARTLVDAGLAQLREGRREAGRASLREALDLADRHHADAVAARAQTELRVAGARPRRCRLSGIEALTPAELRIARLAGEGRTNREIAAALFLSPKTVESHLGRVYAKLDVRHRRELAACSRPPLRRGARAHLPRDLEILAGAHEQDARGDVRRAEVVVAVGRRRCGGRRVRVPGSRGRPPCRRARAPSAPPRRPVNTSASSPPSAVVIAPMAARRRCR
jgi:DNA-binding CsgD family transcriptional regulator